MHEWDGRSTCTTYIAHSWKWKEKIKKSVNTSEQKSYTYKRWSECALGLDLNVMFILDRCTMYVCILFCKLIHFIYFSILRLEQWMGLEWECFFSIYRSLKRSNSTHTHHSNMLYVMKSSGSRAADTICAMEPVLVSHKQVINTVSKLGTFINKFLFIHILVTVREEGGKRESFFDFRFGHIC